MNSEELRELLELRKLRELVHNDPIFQARYKFLKQHIVLDFGIRSMNSIINRKTDKHQYKEYIRALITHANTY